LLCSKEEENVQMLETFEKETLKNQKTKGSNTINFNDPYSLNQEENMMYMTSYLIGLTLLQDRSARVHFQQAITGKQQKISLRSLLDGTNNPFELAFRSRYYIYNWNTDFEGEPTPPISSAIPDPLKKDYDVLDIGYYTYIDLISNTYNWDIHLPNKYILFSFFNFDQYLLSKE
jgi:hypothetical protein